MANAALALDGHDSIEGTADAQGDVIRFTPSSNVNADALVAGSAGKIRINGTDEHVKLESAGPAYINGTGTVMTLRRTGLVV